MINHYGITQQGAYHIEKNLVCQDAHYYRFINIHYAIAAIADGLGSELHSDIASKTAVRVSVEYCSENIKENFDKDEIIGIIRASFTKSLDEINDIVEKSNDDIAEYDTTLVLAVYLNGNVYYGNAGDSGMIVLNQNGKYERVFEQQRDENGHVFPLWFGEEKWEFGYRENVASVLMATDGIYDALFPYLLKGKDEELYVALAHYLMSEDCLRFVDLKESGVQKKMEQYILNIPGKQVYDDKTILVMCDSEIIPEKLDASYYKSPDWAELKREYDENYRKNAYTYYSDNQKDDDLDRLCKELSNMLSTLGIRIEKPETNCLKEINDK